MGHTESAACLLPGPSASWLPTPFPAPGTHSPAALSFCTPGSPHSQFVPSQGGLARSVASGSSLAPGILKLRRVVAVSPGAHLSLTWQGTLPAGLCLSLPLRLSQFPTCTAPLLGGIFPDPSRAEQQLCCHFQDVWIWVCTEDPRAGHYLDFAHRMGILCSRAHFALSIILGIFSLIDSSPALYTLVWTSPNTFPREKRFPAADE